jgi:tetratricopeptide (TPR) repeat protein
MSLRPEVALPAAMTFVFGVAVGIVVSHAISHPPVLPAPAAAAAAPAQPAGEPADTAGEQARLREMLATHEKLLADRPDDLTLLRTVGDYHAALGHHDEAMEHFLHAEDIARRDALPPATLAAILTEKGIVSAESGDVASALRTLEEASRLDEKDARSRVVQVYVYLTRVMPSPPEGFDRRQAVERAEALIAEALAIEPTNADALQFKALIDSVRQRSRPGAGAAPTGP